MMTPHRPWVALAAPACLTCQTLLILHVLSSCLQKLVHVALLVVRLPVTVVRVVPGSRAVDHLCVRNRYRVVRPRDRTLAPNLRRPTLTVAVRSLGRAT